MPRAVAEEAGFLAGKSRLFAAGAAKYGLAAAEAMAAGLPVAPLPRSDQFIVNYRGRSHTFHWVPYFRVVKGDIDPAIFKDKNPPTISFPGPRGAEAAFCERAK